jgi:hypothetical protein
MLVANLAAPVAGSLPKMRVPREHPDDSPAGMYDPPANIPPDDVAIAPVAHAPLKSEYTSRDVLRSFGAGNAPFRHLSESASDLYEVLTGEIVEPAFREKMHDAGGAADVATGLVPRVFATRLPSELADILADGMDGKPPGSDRIASLLQNFNSAVIGHPAITAVRASQDGAPLPSEIARGVHDGGARKPGDVAPAPTPERGPANPHAPMESRAADDVKHGGGQAASDLELAGNHGRARDFSNVRHMNAGGRRTRIVGEHSHLRDYAQHIAPERLPSGQGRIVIVDGHRYLRGDAGFYRVTRAHNADHWLVDAPRHDKAQVPVVYDPETGRWTAHPPLRLCGGGCGSNRGATPDSIALNRNEVDAVLSHLHDDAVQDAILSAYSDVARMQLRRSNRADLSDGRDDSIVPNRQAIRAEITRIPPDAPLFEQQRLAALITATHYRLNPRTEAFCHENAEILFHFLIESGVHGDCIRMLTLWPEFGEAHVLVLYTESAELIDVLEASTPIPDTGRGVDGITGSRFARLIMEARDRTVLLDPWSRVKAVGFALVRDEGEMSDVLDAALADIGHQPGEPFTVALTRPRGRQRSRIGSSASAGSSGYESGSGAGPVPGMPVPGDLRATDVLV